MKRLFILFYGILLAYSLFSYFDAVGQYGTADENTTWSRMMYFLRHGVVEDVTTDGHVALVFVAPLGGALKYLLSLKFKYGDTLLPGIQFNPYVAYNFISILWCLGLLTLCIYLWSRYLGWQWKDRALEIATVALLLMNLPLLKAIIKTLRYDSGSLLLSAAGVLFYLLFLKENQKKFFVLSIGSLSWAFYEKESTLPTLALIAGIELVRRRTFTQQSQALFQIVTLFFLAGYVLITKAWFQPGLAFEPFRSAAGVAGLSPTVVGILVVFAMGCLAIIRRPLQRAVTTFSPTPFLQAAHVTLLFSVVFALFFQSNQIYSGNYLPDNLREQIATENLFVSRAVFGHMSTTLDSSALLTRAKLFASHLRLAAYSLPEPILICLLLFPFLLYRKPISSLAKNATLLFLVNGFVLFLLFSYIFFPVESKYDLNAFVFLAFAGCTLYAQWSAQENSWKRWFAGTTLASLSILPIAAFAPTHFAYHNHLRNSDVEKAEYSQIKYTSWTWSGWGESSYYLMTKLAAMKEAGEVLVDYQVPHSQFQNLPTRNFRYPHLTSSKEIQDWLHQLAQTEKAKFLLISRVQSFRNSTPNAVVNQFRHKAIAVDTRGGTEYGWVFRLSDFSVL